MNLQATNRSTKLRLGVRNVQHCGCTSSEGCGCVLVVYSKRAVSDLCLSVSRITRLTTSNRVLAHVVLKPAFPLSKHLPGILLALRTSLFPENTMLSTKTIPTTTIDPSAAKPKASRGAAIAILNAVPASIARLYLKPSIQTSQHTTSKQRELDEVEQMVAAVQRDILSPFGADEYLTKHLLYTILDHIVLEIFPELSQKTVSQILADKEVATGSEQDDHLEYAV